jgi:two-component system OmpR family response regulator
MNESPDAHRVLVVDDEPNIVDVIAMALRVQGFAVESAGTGAEALAAAEREPPDLVLLDVMLPDMDGFEVIRRMRGDVGGRPLSGPPPVVFLTARDTSGDKINGLTLGGDDYVTKPFDPEELIARIHAVLRRTGGAAALRTLAVGDLSLDVDGHLVSRGGVPVRLSPTEFRLLHYLLLNVGRVLTKRQILQQVWQYDFGGDPSIVDTYISYLRRKIDTGPLRLIHTVHGVGYVVREPK